MMNNAVIAKPVIENPDPAAAVVAAGVAVVAGVVTFDTSGVSVTSISPVVRSTTRSAGVVTSTTTLETSVSVVRELVIMLLSAAVVSENGSTTAVVSGGDIDELVVIVVDVLVLFSVLLVVVVLIAIVLLFVVVLVVVLLVVVLVLVVVDVMLVVFVLVEVITGDEVVDLFGTGISTATELSSIIVGFSSVLSLSELFSRALIAFSIAFVNASWSNASGFCFGCSTELVIIGCGLVKNGSPVKSSVISGKSKLAVVLKSQSGAVGVSSNGVVKKSMIIGGGVVSSGRNSVVSGIGGRPVTGAVSPSVTKSGSVVKSNIDPVVNILGASVGNVITVDKSISGAPVVKYPKPISSVVKAPNGPSVVSG